MSDARARVFPYCMTCCIHGDMSGLKKNSI